MSKKLALIVHGIGEQKAGETLDQLVGAASGEDAGTVKSDIKWMRDQHNKTNPRKVDLFPCHTRTMRVGTKELVFAEVFWADLSTGTRNWVFVLIELIKTILGLGYVVRENIEEKYPTKLYSKKFIGDARPPTPLGRGIRRAATGFVNGLHGPVLCSNLTCVLALIFSFAGLWLRDQEILFFHLIDPVLVPLAVTMSGLTAVLGHYWLRNGDHGYLFSVFVRWLGWYGWGLIALVLMREIGAHSGLLPEGNLFELLPAMDCDTALHCSFQWYVLTLPLAQGLAWCAIIICALFLLLAHRVNPKLEDNSGEPLFSYTCMAMTILFMSTAVILWTAFLQFFETVFVFEAIPATEAERLTKIALAASTPVWIGLLLFLISAVYVVMSRTKWKANYWRAPDAAGDVPRLIVGRPLRIGLILALMVLVVGFGILIPAIYDIFRFGFIDFDFCDMETPKLWFALGLKSLCVGPQVAGVLATLILLGFPLAVGLLGVGLGVAKDIIGYFSIEIARDPKGAPIKGEHAPVLRKRINHRMFQVFERLYRAEQPDEIVIISHSQGTVVAIEAINAGLLSKLDAKQQKKVGLVTMGSPSEHIYARYFRNQFNPERQLLLQDWRTKLARWINIYRVDDFVGTHINSRYGNWPVNYPVNPGGHTGYWSDDEVRTILYATVLSEFMGVEQAKEPPVTPAAP